MNHPLFVPQLQLDSDVRAGNVGLIIFEFDVKYRDVDIVLSCKELEMRCVSHGLRKVSIDQSVVINN